MPEITADKTARLVFLDRIAICGKPYSFRMDRNSKVVVCGAGGFIGGHLVGDLLRQGYSHVRAVDFKPVSEWYQRFDLAENLELDLQENEACERAVQGQDEVYNLAADMGGMGFIELNKALCMLSVLINTHLLLAARKSGVKRFFFASSACVYAANKQTRPDVSALREEDAYPAMPEDGYGWEKLFGERMCRHFTEDFGVVTRVARYHNVYGPHGTYDGGREKAPAAICRKVIAGKLSGNHEIEIWGDGHQTRSFQFIDDCVLGTQKIMESEVVTMPVNLGSSEMVTINQLVDIVEEIAGIKVERHYKLSAPKGVNGRNSDNTLIQKLLGWEPSTPLRVGMEKTYRWIYDQMTANRS
jgi:GDP-D-mannose 3', 5'-epimerase